jgi:hypothetical protein
MSANLWVKPLNRRNFAAWSRQVADDCLFSDDDGILQTKARLMEHLMKLPTAYDHGVDPRDYVVHLYGDTAAVTSRVTDHEQFTDSDIISECVERRPTSSKTAPGSSLRGNGACCR